MNAMTLIANSLYSPVSDEMKKELYEAGFIGNDHNASQSMADALTNRARILSHNQELFVPEEWILDGMEYSEENRSCACGKPNLKKIYKLRNKDTLHTMTVGGSCLKKYFLQEPDDTLMSYISGTSQGRDVNKSLKKKYDGLILSCLGFRKYNEYSLLRSDKKDTPIASNEIIKATLSLGLNSYDSVKWESLVIRAERLYQYLQDAPMRKANELMELKKTRFINSQHQYEQNKVIGESYTEICSHGYVKDMKEFYSFGINPIIINSFEVEDFSAVNGAKLYYQDKYRLFKKNEDTNSCKELHVNEVHRFVQCQSEYYAVASIRYKLYIYQVINDEIRLIGSCFKEDDIKQVIQPQIEEEENLDEKTSSKKYPSLF